ncbi:MAG: Ig-like domain-containing protein [Nitriliruptorales bacterium]
MAKQAIVSGWKPRGRPGRVTTIVTAALVALSGPAALMAELGSSEAAQGDTTLVSRASGTSGAAANDHSSEQSISGNGRFVAFTSTADNLSDQDNDTDANVYMRDLQSGTTSYVRPGIQPSVSSDGRYVAFVSAAPDLSSQDNDFCAEEYYGYPDRCKNVFVHDLQTGTTTLVSRADGSTGAAANGNSFAPAISADGQRVVFTSVAENLSTRDVNQCTSYNEGGNEITVPCFNTFVRDLQAGTTTYAAPGLHTWQGHGCGPAISANGRFVAVETDTSSLSAQDNNGYIDVYVVDLQTGIPTYASRADGLGGAAGGSNSGCPTISADGHVVAFESFGASGLTNDPVQPYVEQIYLRDLVASTTTLVSKADGAAGEPASGGAGWASISADGRHVAFNCPDANLSPSGKQGVFVRDRQTDTTSFVDVGYRPTISDDGRVVAFESTDDSVSAEDNVAYRNIFPRELDPDGAPSDTTTTTAPTTTTTTTLADTTPPETEITIGPSKLTRDNAASFAFTSSEAGSSFMCSLDGGRSGYCTSPHEITMLTDGPHTFKVWASDAAGNGDQTAAEYAWTIDTTAPTVASVFPTPGQTRLSRSVNITASFSEPMDPTTILASGNITIAKSSSTGSPIAAVVTCASPCNSITVDPSSSLAPNTWYVVTIRSGANGVKDLACNPLARDYVWQFKTKS